MSKKSARISAGKLAVFVALAVTLAACCIPNEPFRVMNAPEAPVADRADCDRAYEDGAQSGRRFDLGFVEFSERGNSFRRDCMEDVLAKVERSAKEGNTAVVVFVHGWMHNASEGDGNVQGFRDLLGSLSRNSAKGGPLSDKNVIGIYVGWRGVPFKSPFGVLETLTTYWDRKAVAEEVGRGGITELLLRLEDSVWRPKIDWTEAADGKRVRKINNPKKNVFLVLGHSFGGAAVLSSLNEVFAERLVAAPLVTATAEDAQIGCPNGSPCYRTKPFGHGVVLLNPAIEANQVMPLKELAASKRFARNQTRLLSVVSTDADWATHFAFPLGQCLGMLTWSETHLWRGRSTGGWLRFDEHDLDTTTVGNFAPYRTARLEAQADNRRPGDRWKYRDCVSAEGKEPSHGCVEPEDEAKHFPVQRYEPLSFVYTDANFMSGHGDIFNNPKVQAYLGAVVADSLARRGELASLPELATACQPEAFETCLRYFFRLETQRQAADPKGLAELQPFADPSVAPLK